MFDIQEQLKLLPEEPGVYLMKNKNDKIIYVGKAVSLKNRVRQYFQSSKNHSSKVKSMVSNIASFEYIITDSELEALILECNLIKQYRPKYNVLLRDDKTYPYIKVTVNEDFPRIMKVRRVLKDKAKYFGPYTNVGAVNDTLEIIRNIYPIRNCNVDIPKAIRNSARPCLNYHIKKCVGPCTGNVSKEEYRKMIDEIILFLSGKEETLIEILKEKMNSCAMEFKFEDAAIYRDKIKNLEEIMEKQKIDASNSDVNQDVIALARTEEEACVQVFFMRNSKIIGREHFILEGVEGSKSDSILGSFVKQFYMEQEYIPKEIIIDEELEDRYILEQWLSDKKGSKVTITIPQKGEKKGLVLMVRKNAMEYLNKFSHLNKQKYEKSIGALTQLTELLKLETMPKRIEAYDISNTNGFDSVGSMVVYEHGKPKRNDYRKFKIKTVQGPDDYASMNEVLTRRFGHGLREQQEESETGGFQIFPDLIMMDGGRGQVNIALEVLEKLHLHIPVCGMVKDDNHRTRGLYFNNTELPIDRNSECFRLITRIQDEAHRFAITFHRQLRSKGQVHSVLDDIPGVGPARRKDLMRCFENIDAIRNATVEELKELPSMNEKSAQEVYKFFHQNH